MFANKAADSFCLSEKFKSIFSKVRCVMDYYYIKVSKV